MVHENFGSRNTPPLDLKVKVKAGGIELFTHSGKRTVCHMNVSRGSSHSDLALAVKMP